MPGIRKFPVAKLGPYPGKHIEELDVELCTGASYLHWGEQRGRKKGSKNKKKKGPPPKKTPGKARVERWKKGGKKAAVAKPQKPPGPLTRAQKAALRAVLYSRKSVTISNCNTGFAR